jgi:hypothetical protein
MSSHVGVRGLENHFYFFLDVIFLGTAVDANVAVMGVSPCMAAVTI